MECYSVLMTVSERESPGNLEQAVLSMMGQTVPPADFVLVCDGPPGNALNQTIRALSGRYAKLFRAVSLERNAGAGAASAAGLELCRCELVARMDSDDIALPERCERELGLFEAEPGLSVAGGQIAEFEGSPENVVSVREVPLEAEKILKFCRRRSPFNNTTVMFRKSAALRAGGYSNFRRCEDYDLYARILESGGKTCNLADILCLVRLSEDTFLRRGGVESFRSALAVQRSMYRRGFCGAGDLAASAAARLAVLAAPAFLVRPMYRKLLRRKICSRRGRVSAWSSLWYSQTDMTRTQGSERRRNFSRTGDSGWSFFAGTGRMPAAAGPWKPAEGSRP